MTRRLSVGLCALALGLITPALAIVPEWGQCGGINYTGDTVCAAGLVCTYQNDYYWQCLPGTATTSSTSVSSTTSKTTATSSTTSKTSTTTSSTSTPTVTGFVKVSGQGFTLNGSKFVPVGANSYWVGLTGLNSTYMNQAFSDIAASGATVVRTWGFNEVTSANGVYYQIWNGATPTINTGATGLGNFDLVVAAAKANGIRLIVALTNNWEDYGGMDVYTTQILGAGTPHGNFYNVTSVINAFKNYVNVFVTRYKNEPTIMAWELANEPRCNGCSTTVINTWAKTISSYIKSIDTNHLVALGDEGFYNQTGAATYPYQGGEGIDFNLNLNISTLDFGTVHCYPIPWGQTSDPTDWANQWITDHATSQMTYNKPVIMEEFGITSNQETTYASWYSTIVSSGLTGDLIWQAGSVFPDGQESPNDGYAVYPTDAVYTLEEQHFAAMKARS